MAAQAQQTQPTHATQASQPLQPPRPVFETAGYQALGDVMGSHPEAAIFRRFRNAGALDLLYRQAELQHLFARWAKISERDKAAQANQPQADFDLQFHLLQNSVDPTNTSEVEQWLLWCKISDKLDHYCELITSHTSCKVMTTDRPTDEKLLRFQKVCSLASVDKYQLHDLRMYLDEQCEATGDAFLPGRERRVWNATGSEQDLTAISQPEDTDAVTKLIRGRGADFWHTFRGHDMSHQIMEVSRLIDDSRPRAVKFKKYPDDKVARGSMVVYALVTTSFVVFAVMTLSRRTSSVVKNLLIFLHNALFTGTLALLTPVRPVELFAAAAAYAAVLVVFSSGSVGPSSPSEP